MLDVITQLEAAGMETAFEAEGQSDLPSVVQARTARWSRVAMTCLVMTPDGGETEPQQDEPSQDDDGKQDEQAEDSL
ncbi:hypothetical protein CMZ82_02745 [Lysobacteraceae bacterium NML93-0792]|nr:hypothetical protein CMZ82_02745 [Xanthomonadaceae bacterium NML93-0792]PBS16320.1 hypothetical protein CMZ81_05870 [Xanthomonadaceae bacterium NML93-0793]PBS19130.1 hypothetical protein CMZ80_08015 [Xanthomonadaceae bacterium NML93-0831]